MKVGELINELKKFDPELEVGGRGHFGELLKLEKPFIPKYIGVFEDKPFVCLEIEDAGPEPN